MNKNQLKSKFFQTCKFLAVEVPRKPRNLSLSHCTGRSVRLDWNGLEKRVNDTRVTSYTVNHRKLGEKNWIESEPISDGETQYEAAGLSAGQLYEFMVIAYIGMMKGLQSDIVDMTKCQMVLFYSSDLTVEVITRGATLRPSTIDIKTL